MRIFNCLAALLATMLMASAAASQTGTQAVPEATVQSVASPLPELDAARQGQLTRLPPFDFSSARSASLEAPVQARTAGLETAFPSERDRYTLWGLLIGGVAGLGFGLARDEGGQFDMSPTLETTVGAFFGAFAGAAIYQMRSLGGGGRADQ